jgi:2-polyprenyl-6-methoxyphenol hydroxylase-like FAD-dependent oxidoreductase
VLIISDRGEAANHGIKDAQKLCEKLVDIMKGGHDQKTKMIAYESEMRDRTSWAVMMSRQACLDAHDFKSLNKDSAILARRTATL